MHLCSCAKAPKPLAIMEKCYAHGDRKNLKILFDRTSFTYMEAQNLKDASNG